MLFELRTFSFKCTTNVAIKLAYVINKSHHHSKHPIPYRVQCVARLLVIGPHTRRITLSNSPASPPYNADRNQTHHHASFVTDFLALVVHRFDCMIPFDHALAPVGEIEPGDGYFARNYRIDGGAPVAHHEQKFRLQK